MHNPLLVDLEYISKDISITLSLYNGSLFKIFKNNIDNVKYKANEHMLFDYPLFGSTE